MRIPDPKANTTTEAYLAYKAGYLEESELKPVLYEPYLHFDAWLAYWAGLTNTYPEKNVGKNLFNEDKPLEKSYLDNSGAWVQTGTPQYINQEYRLSGVKELTLSFGSKTGFPNIRLGEFDGDTFIKRTLVNDTPTTITLNASTNKVIVSIDKNDNYFTDLQIEVGSSATAYVPYTGEPEMLCDEEALVAYLAGVTDTYPEDIKDPYDVRIVGYLKYLVSARWGRPDYPVNNEEFYLSTMKPPVVPSGDTPSSDIEMDDTVEAPFVDLKMYGNTSQNTCAGDQLFTKQGFATPITDTNFWGSFAQSKLKHTPLADGWAGIEVKETSGSVFGDMNINQEGVKGFAASTTYTIIVEIKDKSGAGTDGDNMKNLCLMQPNSIRDAWDSSSVNIVQGAIWTGGTNVVVTLADSDWTSRTAVVVATTKEDLTNVFSCRFFTRPTVPAGTSFKMRVSVLSGDHSSDWQNYAGDNYQPYVGGIASPNPDYPQAVQTVTGEQTVNVSGKNLFDGILELGFINGSTGLDGASNGYIRGKDYIPVKELTNYKFSTDNANITTVFVYEYKADKSYNLTTNKNISLDSYFTTNANTAYIRFRPGYRTTDTSIRFQVEEGTVATAYEPYQSQSYPISLGSIELCKIGDYQDYIYKSGDDWYLHKEIGANSPDVNAGQLKDYTNVDYIQLNKPTDYAGYGNFACHPMLCTHAIVDQQPAGGWDSANGVGKAWVGAVKTAIWIGFENGTTLSAMKAALVGAKFYYAVATPTDTQITNSELISQLDALMEGGSCEGKTFIKVTADSPNLPAGLIVEAAKYA